VYAGQERKMYADYFTIRKLLHPILELKNLYLLSSGVLVPANRLKINLINPLEYRIKRIIAPNYQKQVIFSGSLDGMI